MMRQGYSILLGETLDASELEYHDCEGFQLVCPTCREPLFKCVRASGRTEALHYLSHYSASVSASAECSLRATQSAARVTSDNRISREQRLEYFLSVLRRTLALDPLYAKSAEDTHGRLNKSPGLTWLRDECFSTAQANIDTDEFFVESAHDYASEMRAAGWKVQTSFSQSVQLRIAHDMWRTLTTKQAKSNFEFLFNHAFLRVIGGFAVAASQKNPRSEIAGRLADYGYELIIARGPQALALLRKMFEHDLPAAANVMRDGTLDTETSSYGMRLAAKTTIEMVGVLVGLPYFELLKQHYGDPGKVYPYVASEVPESDATGLLAPEDSAHAKSDRRMH